MDLHKLFPFPEIRPLQKKALNKIAISFGLCSSEIEKPHNDIMGAYDGGKEYVVLEAPTGFGKSAVAVTIARAFGSSHMITTQKILQRQYCRDFKDIFLIQGKSNYDCDRYRNEYCGFSGCEKNEAFMVNSEGRTDKITKHMSDEQIRSYGALLIKAAGNGVSETNIKGQYKIVADGRAYFADACYYKANYIASRASQITLHNFSSFLYQAVLAGLHKKRELLIVDEAHNTENMILDFFDIRMSDKLLGDSFPTFLNCGEIDEYFTSNAYDWCKRKIYQNYARDINSVIGAIFEEKRKEGSLEDSEEIKMMNPGGFCSRQGYLAICAWIIEKSGGNGARTLARQYSSFVVKISLFVKNYKKSDFVFEKEDKGIQTLIIKPVCVDFWAHNLLDFGDKKFMTSATLPPKDVFCRGLGIDEDKVEFIKMPSEFPAKNRKIYVSSVGRLIASEKAENLPKIIPFIKSLMASDKYRDVRGIIHTHSNDISKFIKDNIISDRLLLADRFENDRDAMIEHHSTRENSILVSPSMYEGLDLADDLSRFQIIVKMPYPYLDLQVNARKQMPGGMDWYLSQAAVKIVQAYGRSVRHKDDWADTFILDGSFINFYNGSSRRFFPEWFAEAIIL